MGLLSKIIERNKNFIKGIGSVLNIYPISDESNYNTPTKTNGFKTDVENISRDWKNIGKDMTKVTNNYIKDYKC